MTLINIAIVIISYFTFTIMIYFIRKDTPRISRNKLISAVLFTGSVFAVFYPFWEMAFGDSIQMVNLYIFIEFIISAFPAFLVYPGKLTKNLFFISTTTPLLVVGHGLGNLTERTFGGGELPGRILNLLIMSACFAVIIAGLYYVTQKKFPGLYETESPKFWSRLWIITIIMGLTQLVAGNIYVSSSFRTEVILPSRLMCLAGMAAILYIAGLAKRQAEEFADTESRAAAAEQAVFEKEKAYKEITLKMEENSRFRHDSRQIVTAIRIMNEPGKERELIDYCLELLDEMKNTDTPNPQKTEITV